MICRVCQKPLNTYADVLCVDPADDTRYLHPDCARQEMAGRERSREHWFRVGPGLLAALEELMELGCGGEGPLADAWYKALARAEAAVQAAKGS